MYPTCSSSRAARLVPNTSSLAASSSTDMYVLLYFALNAANSSKGVRGEEEASERYEEEEEEQLGALGGWSQC